MSARDFMPWTSQLGQYIDVKHFPMNAAETFVIGEPVSVNADGELTETATDGAIVDFIGFALAPASYNISGVAVTKNPRTGVNYTTGDNIPVAMARPGATFITRNFSTGGGGVLVAPTLANAIGEVAGLILTGGVWFLDVGSATAGNRMFRIVDVLNASRNSILDPAFDGTAGVFVVAEATQTEMTVVTAPAA